MGQFTAAVGQFTLFVIHVYKIIMIMTFLFLLLMLLAKVHVLDEPVIPVRVTLIRELKKSVSEIEMPLFYLWAIWS